MAPMAHGLLQMGSSVPLLEFVEPDWITLRHGTFFTRQQQRCKHSPRGTVCIADMSSRYRHRRWIALIALLGLLFQQVAMAAYFCPAEMATPAMAMSADMPDCEQAAHEDKARCESRCHPQAVSSDHAAQPPVPPALLPPTTWLRGAARQSKGFAAAPVCEVAARAAAPPISIRDCTFQI